MELLTKLEEMVLIAVLRLKDERGIYILRWAHLPPSEAA